MGCLVQDVTKLNTFFFYFCDKKNANWVDKKRSRLIVFRKWKVFQNVWKILTLFLQQQQKYESLGHKSIFLKGFKILKRKKGL